MGRSSYGTTRRRNGYLNQKNAKNKTPQDTTTVSEMRTYIFTEAERKVLHQWLSGTLAREESPLLHTTLGRLRRSERQIIQDLRLFTLALRRLHLIPKLRKRREDMETTLALAPIPIHTPENQIRTYIKLIRPFREAQSIANDQEATTENRLRAIELAAKIGRALIDISEDKPDYLINQLEKFKKHTTQK